MAQPTITTTPDPIDRAADAAARLTHSIWCRDTIDPDSADTVSAYLRTLVEPTAAAVTIPPPAAEQILDLTTPAGYGAAIDQILAQNISDEEKINRLREIRTQRRAVTAVDWEAVLAPAPCPPWCSGGCEDTDGAQLHELLIGQTIGRDVDSIHERMHAAVELEAYDSADGTVHEPASVVVTLAPTPVPEVNMSKLKDLDLDDRTIRYLAAGVLSGTHGGEKVRLTPAQAVLIGTALVEAGRLGGAKVPE